MHFLSGKTGTGSQQRAIISRRILFGIVLGIALAADLVTKWAAFRFLRPGQRVKAITGLLDMEPVLNKGIVFGLPAPIAVTIFISAVATVVVVWYLMTPRGRAPVVQLYLGLILSGVIGNLFDRLTIGAVRDFILLYVGKGAGEHRWPNFNIADAFILIGVILAMIQFILTEDKKKAKPGKEAARNNAGEPAQKETG